MGSRTLAAIAAVAMAAPALATPPVWDEGFGPEDIIVWYSCSADCDVNGQPPSADNPNCLGYGLQTPGGWPRLMSTNIYKDYEAGYRRFLLHLPLGNEYDNGGMDIDIAQDNIEAGFAHVQRDFLDALEWADLCMKDAEFIVYLGGPDQDVRAALNNDNRFADHWQRISGAGWTMELVDFPNVSLAFDASVYFQAGTDGNFGAGDPHFQFLKLLESYKNLQDRRVYIEAMPFNMALFNSPNDLQPYLWHRTMPWIAFEYTYTRQSKRWVNAQPPLQSPDGIRCMLTPRDLQEWDGKGGAYAWAADCIRKGHSPAINRSNSIFPWKDKTAAETAFLMSRNLN